MTFNVVDPSIRGACQTVGLERREPVGVLSEHERTNSSHDHDQKK